MWPKCGTWWGKGVGGLNGLRRGTGQIGTLGSIRDPSVVGIRAPRGLAEAAAQSTAVAGWLQCERRDFSGFRC